MGRVFLGQGEASGRAERSVCLTVVVIIFQAVAVGAWAGSAHRSFVADFPSPGLRWIVDDTALGQHFIRDVGVMRLALGLVALRAGWQVGQGLCDARRPDPPSAHSIRTIR